MAGNNIYVQGSYIDVHDNEVVNLSVDKGEVHVGDHQLPEKEHVIPEVLAGSELWHRNNMRSDYNTALDQRKSLEFQERLKHILG